MAKHLESPLLPILIKQMLFFLPLINVYFAHVHMPFLLFQFVVSFFHLSRSSHYTDLPLREPITPVPQMYQCKSLHIGRQQVTYSLLHICSTIKREELLFPKICCTDQLPLHLNLLTFPCISVSGNALFHFKVILF